jgi:hypothetical protein
MARITVNLSATAARQAESRAALEGRGLEEYLADVLEGEFAEDLEEEKRRLGKLSDEDVLAMADLKLPDEDDRRLSELLDLNREGRLTSEQRQELDGLMKRYSVGTLQKAKGWAEAVRRKLREPIQP